jgi:electron transfer flavoprotein alpha subunit
MELAPAVALKTGVPVVTGCVDFALEDHRATVKRLIHAAKVSVTFEVSTDKGAILSIQKGALKDVDTDEPAQGPASLRVTTLPWKEEWAAEKTEIIELIQEAVGQGEDITKARILVSVGRGLGGQDGLPMARELAGLVGGMVSCSRPVVDLGWLPSLHQVGLSGKSVSPVIYLALGISGQGNHVVGMETSKIIIAVNKDPQAPIFQIAHYGIVDDIQQFVPQLIEHMKREDG